MRPLIVLALILTTACAPSESTPTARVDATPDTPPAEACAGSPALGAYTAQVPTTHHMSVTSSCKVETAVECGSVSWEIGGLTDATFATTQTITLTRVGSTWGAYNAYCLRPEFSPYTCTATRYWDAGLGKYVLSLSCDQSYSKAWLAN